MLATSPVDRVSIVPFPKAPATLEDCGVPFDALHQLALKWLHVSGELSGAQLAAKLGLCYSVIDPVLYRMKLTHLVQVSGGGLTAGPSFVYRITETGRERAASFMQQCQYLGPAPVPFTTYSAYMHAFAEAAPRSATRERVRRAFRRLVLSQRVLDQLGPAVNGAHSVFVYGPPGNGKTVIAQAIRELLDGDIAIPHAIEADGHIIRVLDAAAHDPVPGDPVPDSLDGGAVAEDQRWVRCRRPMVMVGGELQLAHLDLAYRPSTHVYQAPLQLTANGGVLIIDDFGRQKCSPVALLNRWITPLESRVDFLTLHTGQKLVVPFAVLVVFATNIKPAELLDEAFLRRIRYKVFAESPTLDDFKQIFRNCCDERSLEFDDALVDGLVRDLFAPRRIPMRGTHPRDLIDQALSLAEYLGQPRRLTPELMLEASASYFVDERESPAP